MNVDKQKIIDAPIKHLTDLTEELDCTVLLKGPASYLGLPSGEIFVNYFPNDGMATGGTGDVLAGILGGLYAQGIASKDFNYEKREEINKERFYQDTCLGIAVHTLAGHYASKDLGPRAMSAGSIINYFNEAFKSFND